MDIFFGGRSPNETTLLVEPGNAEELASQMTKLIDDEVLTKRLGKNGKKLYLKRYQKKTVIRKTLSIYGFEGAQSKDQKKAA